MHCSDSSVLIHQVPSRLLAQPFSSKHSIWPFHGYGSLLLDCIRCWIFVLSCASLAPPGADSWYVGLVPHLFCPICLRCELDECVQGHVHPRTLCLVLLHEVCVDASQHGLVCNDENILASFQLHDDGLKSNNNVTVRLAASITVVILVLVAGGEIFGIPILDFLVCQAVANSRV